MGTKCHLQEWLHTTTRERCARNEPRASNNASLPALAVDHLGLPCDDGGQVFLLFALRHVEVVLGAPVTGRLYTCSSATGGALSNQRITLLQGTAAPPHWLQ